MFNRSLVRVAWNVVTSLVTKGSGFESWRDRKKGCIECDYFGVILAYTQLGGSNPS